MSDPQPHPEPAGLRLGPLLKTGVRSHWHRADQTSLDRVVALKFLLPELAESRILREAFLDAGRQAAVMVHPAAVPIINVFPKENCVAMHYCAAGSLREHGANLDAAGAAAIAESILDCLSSLHATGRCHGNLSPGNVFLDQDGKVLIDDFFQPPVLRCEAWTFTGDASCVAPEVAAGGAPDWRADVFSLGRLLALTVDPDCVSPEMDHLLETLQSADPQERGGSPAAVAEAFGRIRRFEVAKLGMHTEERRSKRQYRRIPAEFDISMRRRSATPGETAVLLMKIRDIGESGVFVETDDEFIGVGSILELDFSLRGAEGNVHAFGIVRWKSSPPMARGVGVQFVEVDQSGLAKLRKYLASRSTTARPKSP